MIKQFKLAAAAVALAGAFASTANAGGFLLTEQSALGLGRAYAGIGVDGTDQSGVYFNPATMMLHKGTHLQMGGVYVDTNMEYSGKDATGNPVSENGRGHGEVVPNFFYTTDVTENMRFGLGVTVPFGMNTSYNEDWAENTSGISSRILTIDVNPNFAWKLNEKWSFGAGASIQYARASLKTGKNIANIASFHSQIKADSISWGYNFGVMFTPVDNIRLGLSYRSQIKHDAEGDLSFGNYQGADLSENPDLKLIYALAKNNAVLDGAATVTAPAWAMLNAAWDVNEIVSLYATLRWTDWSSFDELTLKGNGMAMSTIENHWKDTYLGTIGFDYRLNPTWTLRAGIGYETSPVDKEEYRMAIIPDTDRLWLSLGASYKLDDRFQFDVGFSHLRGVGDRDLYRHVGDNYTKAGEFDSLDAYLVGAQMQYKF